MSKPKILQTGIISPENLVIPEKKLNQKIQENFKCTCCGTIYNVQAGFFSKALSNLYAGNNGFISVCNDCLKMFHNEYKTSFKSKNKATKRMCMHFDVFYSEALVKTVDGLHSGNYIIDYFAKALQKNKSWSDQTYAHTIKLDENMKNGKEELDKESFSDEQLEELEKLKEFWGVGFPDEKYFLLKGFYEKWTEDYPADEHAQRVIFKQLSFIELQIHESMVTQNGKTTDLLKQLSDYMNSAGIKPSQNKQSAKELDIAYSNFISKIEDKEPVEIGLENANLMNSKNTIVQYISIWFLGHLCAMLGLKNKWYHLYMEELEKYTVKPPESLEDSLDENSEETFESVYSKLLDE